MSRGSCSSEQIICVPLNVRFEASHSSLTLIGTMLQPATCKRLAEAPVLTQRGYWAAASIPDCNKVNTWLKIRLFISITLKALVHCSTRGSPQPVVRPRTSYNLVRCHPPSHTIAHSTQVLTASEIWRVSILFSCRHRHLHVLVRHTHCTDCQCAHAVNSVVQQAMQGSNFGSELHAVVREIESGQAPNVMHRTWNALPTAPSKRSLSPAQTTWGSVQLH
jgi:hypothetical protein